MRLCGESAQQAADAVLAEVAELGGRGGVIVAGAATDWAFSFTTPGMFRAMAQGDDGLPNTESIVAIYGDE
jgi:beta-aspartyl-peptidase (threonine type)